MFKNFIKYFILGSIGGISYVLLEITWRGFSHWSRYITAFLAFIIIGGVNEFLTYKMPLWKQCLIGSMVITILEFICGCIVNIGLNWDVWNYSDLPFNILGQICLPFSILWFVLSGAVIIADDWLRYFLFKEEKPHYKLV